jgi:spore coat protein CotF
MKSRNIGKYKNMALYLREQRQVSTQKLAVLGVKVMLGENPIKYER